MFRLPTRVLIQAGSRHQIPSILEEFGAKRILVVTDEGVRSTDWFDGIARLCKPAHIDDSIQPNPKHQNVERLGDKARRRGFDAVVGVGGGSVLDAAKAVSMLASNEGPIGSFEGKDKFSNPAIPFLAVPTTCGTGSEVTWVSVISVVDEARKISIKGHGMFPAFAIVDADLIATLPSQLVASTGMDAFTHAIEAVVGKPANPVSDTLAIGAMKLLLEHLVDASQQRGSSKSKEKVMLASTMAGMAFGNADVGAVHCLSESIGGLLDLPHGLLNTLLLAPVLEYQREAIEEPISRVSKALGISQDSFYDEIQIFIKQLPLPTWASLGIDGKYFERIAQNAEGNGSNGSNRMDMQASDYQTILKSMPLH